MVKGTVSYVDGTPIPNATVFVDGTFYEDDTNDTGYYELRLQNGSGKVLVRAHKKGYLDVEETVNVKPSQKEITLHLMFTSKIYVMDEMVFSQPDIRTVGQIPSLALNELEVILGAPDASVITALSTISGTQQVGETGELSVRGGAGYETKYFFDGMIVRNQLGASIPSQSSSFRFSPSLFKNLELNAGGYSAEYGQALSSILLMETKGVSRANTVDFFVSPFFVDTKASYMLGGTQSLEANVNYTNFGPYANIISPNIDYLKLENGPESLSGNLFYKYEVGDKGVLKAFSYWSATNLSSSQESIDNSTVREQSDIHNSNTYDQLSFKYVITPSTIMNLGLAYGYNQDRIKVDTVTASSVTKGNLLNRTTRDLHAKASIKTDFSSSFFVNSGIEFFRLQNSFGFDEQNVHLNENLVALYSETTLRFWRQFYTSVGLRTEYSWLTKKNNFAPRFNVKYISNSNTHVGFSYGTFYQQPLGTFLLENSQLNYLKAQHYIITLEKQFNDRIGRLEVYNKSYPRLIKNTGNQISTSGDGYARGVDLYWKDERSLKNFNYRVNYSYLDAQRNYIDYPVRAPFRYASRHKMALSVNRFFFNGDLITGLNYSYTSGRPYYNPNRKVNAFHSDLTDNIHTLSANLVYNFKVNQTPVLLISTINNILNTDQIYGYTYSEQDYLIRRPLQPLYSRLIFFGCFISFGLDKSDEMIDQLLND